MHSAFSLLVYPNSMLTRFFQLEGYVLSGEIAHKNNHYYYYYVKGMLTIEINHSLAALQVHIK